MSIEFIRKFGRAIGGMLPVPPAAFVPASPAAPTSGTLMFRVPLTWGAVSGATGYKVYRDGSLVGSPSSASLDDFVASGSYVYTVKATGPGGDSAASPGTTVVASSGGGETVSVF